MAQSGDEKIQELTQPPPFVLLALWESRGQWQCGSTLIASEIEAHDAASWVQGIPGVRVFFITIDEPPTSTIDPPRPKIEEYDGSTC